MQQRLLFLAFYACIMLQGCISSDRGIKFHTDSQDSYSRENLFNDYRVKERERKRIEMARQLGLTHRHVALPNQVGNLSGMPAIYGLKGDEIRPGNTIASSNDKNESLVDNHAMSLGIGANGQKNILRGDEKGISPPRLKKVSQIIDDVNRITRVEPKEEDFRGAVAEYAFSEGSLFSIYTAIGKITDIRFQATERILSVSAGDTANYLIEHVEAAGTPHLLIKPLHKYLQTNITVITDKRVYYLFIKSWQNTFMAGCRWRYPKEKLLEKKRVDSKQSTLELPDWKFDYAIKTDCKDCIKPTRVFSDIANGKLYIQMPESIKHYAIPALFSFNGRERAKIINYRFIDGTFIIDTLYPRVMLKYNNKYPNIYIYENALKGKKSFSLLNRIFGK